MKYYIEESEKNIEQLYKSICPIKKVRKNEEELYRHVKQVLCRRSATLFVDDVQLYIKAGGKTGEMLYNNGNNKTWYLPATWEGISGKTERLPHKTFNLFESNNRADGYRSQTLIISKNECGDVLTITSEDVDYASSKDGLTAVATLYTDYYKSWWIDIPRKESEKHYTENVRALGETYKGSMSYRQREALIDSIIHCSQKDSGIVRLAKMEDYVILSELIYRLERNREGLIPFTDLLSNRSNLYYTHGRPGSYRGSSDIYFIPYRWIFEASYENRTSMEQIVQSAESLAKAKDKDYAKSEFKRLMSRWKELGIETDQALWERMVTAMKTINQQ